MFHPDYGSQGWIETRNNLIGLWTFWVLIFMCQKFSFLLFIVHCWASSKAKKKTNREFGELKGIKYYLLSFITFHSRAIFITNFNFASYKITFFFFTLPVLRWLGGGFQLSPLALCAPPSLNEQAVKGRESERERQWESLWKMYRMVDDYGSSKKQQINQWAKRMRNKKKSFNNKIKTSTEGS